MEDDAALTSDRTGSPNHVDDLFNYDFGLDELLQQAPSRTENAETRQPASHATSGLGLGLDEEVKVTKKRQPIAKLDEGRLLSQPGIPKLRRTAKEKLKFRGKGHEFSDAARLLNFYQLWLDDLFPRAKFTDGLAMIERLGHSKRLQTMRREWIEEEKPMISRDIQTTSPHNNPSTDAQIDDAELTSERHNTTRTEIRKDFSDSAIPDGEQHPLVHHSNFPASANVDEQLFMSDDDFPGLPDDQGAPDDDELDALLREQEDLAYKNTSI